MPATSIDWRAFWVSFATVMLAIIFFAVVLEPLIRKYKIHIVQGGGEELKAAA